MTSRLRTAIQFATLDRKIRALGKVASGPRSAAVLSLVKPGLVGFELRRSALWNQPAPDSELLGQGIERAASYPVKRVAELSLSDLTAFQAILTGSETARFRKSPVEGRHASEVMPAEMAPGALGRLFDWMRSDAFAELHPVEQMTLCQARLTEIAPFENYSNAACDLFSLLILNLGASLLPAYTASDADDFEKALDDALGLVMTKPLVDLNAKVCVRTCDALSELLRIPT